MTDRAFPHVAIIGAGPAGLAAAVCLGREGVSCEVLERGGREAAGLRRVDPAMRLLSPARLSRLPYMGRVPGEPSYATFGDLVAALARYREQHGVEVTAGANVTSVTGVDGGFHVHWVDPAGQAHVAEASHVIHAAGITAAPRLPPDLDPARFELRWLHSLDTREEHIAGSRRLLVVGAGASAADVLASWLRVRRPGDQAWISCRSPLKVLPRRVLGLDFHYFTWLPEHLPARPLGPLLAARDAMFGHEVPRAIRQGAIAGVAGVDRYERESVVLHGGAVLEPDLTVFATGFRPIVDHLEGLVDLDASGWPIATRCQSPKTRGLYLLGVRFARTLASPYLRGIARDARFVARQITRSRRRLIAAATPTTSPAP